VKPRLGDRRDRVVRLSYEPPGPKPGRALCLPLVPLPRADHSAKRLVALLDPLGQSKKQDPEDAVRKWEPQFA